MMNVQVRMNNGVAAFIKFTFALLMMCKHGQRFDPIAVEQEIENQPRHHERGEQARRDTDGQRHTETFDRSGAHENQDHGRNQRRDVRIEDRSERARITGVNRAAQCFALGQFLTQTFVDQHVRVHRHADGQYHTRDTRQRERRAHGTHDAHQDDEC